MIKSYSETRRVKMTKTLIKSSLMELLENKTLSSISVTELCNRAEVNRSTFYAYYDDILSVVEEVEDELIKMIPAAKDTAGSGNMEELLVEDITRILRYIRTYSKFFNILLQLGDLNFKESLMHRVLRNFPIKADTGSDELYLGYVFAMNGVIGLMQEWIKNDFPYDERTLARLAVKMSLNSNDYPKVL